MLKLSELFCNCNTMHYDVVGKDVSYKFVEDGDILYIYFQGSNQVTDWVRNFLFKKKPYKDTKVPYKVHRGFLEAWKEVEDIVIKKINEPDAEQLIKADVLKLCAPQAFDYKWKHIVVIGYSHGGALSGLCHECVWYHRPDLRENGLEGYGFESPRFFGGFIVSKKLKERWNNYFMIRTNNDLVTHCPPAIFRYCHVGKVLKVSGDTKLVNNKLPKCIKSHYPEVVEDALVKYENRE